MKKINKIKKISKTSKTKKIKKIILVIEDDVALSDAVKIKLEKNNFEVLVASSVQRAFSTELEKGPKGQILLTSVEKALEFIKKLERVDAIWVDHNLLGDENGLDFVKKFKENGGHFPKVPIFVVSNTGGTELAKSYFKLGANKYFVKAEHRLEDIISEIKKSLD